MRQQWGCVQVPCPPPALSVLCFPRRRPGELEMSPLPLETRVPAEPNGAPN